VTVPRPRLKEPFSGPNLPRLTAVVAGPGFGKTTLLTQCCESRTAVLHTLSPADRSLSVFARNVVRKLRLVAPRISPELLVAVEGGRGPDVSLDSGRPMAIAAALAHDLDDALHQDVLLVLDDVHEIEPGSDSANFLAGLCRHVPLRLRLVAASREPLPFPTARMKVAGEFSEITASELAFTLTEIEELIQARLGRDDPELAKEVSTLTSGWPVATVLAVQGETTSARHRLVGHDALFDYLTEEVLTDEDEIIGLAQAALLPWITTELLSHLGIAPSPALEPTSVYMSTVPNVPGGYAVAPMVRDYLQERHPIDQRDSQDLLVSASSWYRARGELADALACARTSESTEVIVQLLTEDGHAMVATGHHRQVIDAIAALDDESVSGPLALIDAEARQLVGDWEGATERYNQLVPDEGPIPPGVAWRLGFLNHMQGKVGAALETYQRGERGTGNDRDEAALLGWQASAHWLRGERGRARDLASDALELARKSEDPGALATAHTVLAMVAALEGDRAANDMHYLKALEHAERGRDVVQTIRIRSNRASAYLEEGEFDSALAELDIALNLADMTGFELWRGLSLSNRAQVHGYRGRLEEAVADFNEARTALRRIGSLLESYPVAHLGDVYRLRGDIARSRAAYEEAIAMGEGQQDLQLLVPAYSGLATLIASRDPDTARELAAKATAVDAGIGRAHALAAAGWAEHHSGRDEPARELAVEASKVARVRHDQPGLGEALELLAAVDPANADQYLEEALSVWRRLDAPIATARVELARALRIGGVEGAMQASQAAETLQRHGASGLAREARNAEMSMSRRDVNEGLVIKTLGGFDVLVAGKSTPRSAWQSRVAREILWMLISARGRPLTREQLIDRLWPDEDPAKASNRLSVALSTVRKVIDPDGIHQHHHIESDRDSVRFNREHAVVDVEEFLDDVRKGRSLIAAGDRDRGLALLKAAEERYLGDFLEEEPYADWTLSLREEARSEYLSVAERLAEAASDRGDHDGAARRYLRMLETDPYNEPAHLSLVAAMMRSGRHGTARRLYGNYVTRMAELGVEPEPFPDSRSDPAHS
jgi:ATP/maltotriose-dependent transcriptional regulator MalT/DNA-binding SARP family transcriptional activator